MPERKVVVETLAQIICDTAPKFTAGVVLWNDTVIEAAPIVGYMKKQKWSRDRVREYCKQKGWTVSVVWQNRRHGSDFE